MKPKHGRALDDKAWAKLLHAFDLMAAGLDEEGNELYRDSSGLLWKFCLLFACADTEQLCLGWGLMSYNNIGEMCGYCLADRELGGRPHTNLQDDAAWRDTCPLPNDVL